ncbi:hypothetical protein N7490_003740 [Penicillium lividum]|nr:hypothetical protein N7490_003740 [Penicillium lividum]
MESVDLDYDRSLFQTNNKNKTVDGAYTGNGSLDLSSLRDDLYMEPDHTCEVILDYDSGSPSSEYKAKA